MPHHEFIEKTLTTFKNELIYYTHPNVQATSQQVGAPSKESWTKLLFEKGFIPQPPATKDRYIELERALSALYCFELRMREDYDGFTEVQKNQPDEILTQ